MPKKNNKFKHAMPFLVNIIMVEQYTPQTTNSLCV